MTSNMVTTYWFEDFIKKLPMAINDEDPFVIIGTFSFNRKRRLIKKKIHKQKRNDKERIVSETKKSLILNIEWTNLVVIKTPSISTMQASMEIISKLMDKIKQHKEHIENLMFIHK
jgi:hypothetical protein